MGVLAALNKEVAGAWTTLADFLRDARTRDALALGALHGALAATPEEQRELAGGEGAAVLLELACDLRVPKGARLAATRCLIESGTARIGALFAGAGDLVTDPRLGGAARKLAEGGLPAALQGDAALSHVTPAAGAFARAAHAAASAVGLQRVRELLSAAPPGHAGAAAARFALGLCDLEGSDAWQKLLDDTRAAHAKAPPAAKRMGLVPAWPPNLPDAFAPLVAQAERSTAAADVPEATPRERVPSPAPEAGPARKQLAPAIRRSPFRRPVGNVVEVPKAEAPAKTMAPMQVRPSAPLPGIAPLPSRAAEEHRVDPRGRRIPRADRFRDDAFEWEAPLLPPSSLPPPRKAGAAQAPFAARLRSLLEDRPEAVDRLCAATDARVAAGGLETVVRELEAELLQLGAREAPAGQLVRLRTLASDSTAPATWQAVAHLLLRHLQRA